MRRQVTLTPDTVFENQRTSKVYRMYTKQQRRLLRQSTFTNLIAINPFEMNDWRYAAIHIRVLSLVDESSLALEIIIDLHQ